MFTHFTSYACRLRNRPPCLFQNHILVNNIFIAIDENDNNLLAHKGKLVLSKVPLNVVYVIVYWDFLCFAVKI